MAKKKEVVALQPVSIVDHICSVTEEQLKALVPLEDIGGSRRCEIATVQEILATLGEFTSKAGGSASNTCRGLAAGFGVDCHLIGARGGDEWGAIYNSSMRRAGVETSGLVVTKGATGRSVILSCNGERTMRTCLSEATPLMPDALVQADLNAEFVFLSGYCLHTEGFVERVVELAALEGSKVMFDLASWETVRRFRPQLESLLQSGKVHGVFCNEDEAIELMGGRGTPDASISAAQAHITKHCEMSIVTLGERGCALLTRQGVKVEQKAVSVGNVVDTTGAGDLFASGFLYGLLRGYSLERCCEIGCIAGAAVVQVIGAELTEEKWKWFHGKLHGDLAASVVRGSADIVHKELLAAYALVEKQGRGVVYYGSARLKEGCPHWPRAKALGRDVALLLGCSTWSGGGPGMMEAASRGAMEAGCRAVGIRIAREAGTTVLSSSYLPPDCQLKKLGSKLKVPIILCNWDGFYTGLMDYLVACEENNVLKAQEMDGLVLADTNEDILRYLSEFYNIPLPAELAKNGDGDLHIQTASHFIECAITRHKRQKTAATNGNT